MRVALLGVGRLGVSHAKTLSEIPDVTELRIYDADQSRSRATAAEINARACDTLEEALEGAEALVIVTPTDTHAALIMRALERGIPTFCEKPIAIDLEETRAVVQRVNRTNGRLQIGFQRRFDAGYRAAKKELQEGHVGSVYSFYMTSRDAIPPADSYIRTSGGQFKDQMIHDLDITRWLFDDEVVEVFAAGSTLGFPTYEEMKDASTSAVLVKLRGGALGLISAARHNPAGYDIRVEIYGSKDSIVIGLDPRAPIRSVEQDAPRLAGPAYTTFLVRFADAYRAELTHFLRFAEGEAENPCTAEDALEALRIAEAAGHSWREGRPVRVQEVE
jgi:myo-inositol 2-dehydrogenase/D-chiro-inositol 1-dehydrogenase